MLYVKYLNETAGEKKSWENFFFPSENRSDRQKYIFILFFFYFYLFIYFLLFKATPTAYGGSQAIGQIRATAVGLHHSHKVQAKPVT